MPKYAGASLSRTNLGKIAGIVMCFYPDRNKAGSAGSICHSVSHGPRLGSDIGAVLRCTLDSRQREIGVVLHEA